MTHKLHEPAPRRAISVMPYPAGKQAFIDHALMGRMNAEDQAYMARALLSLSDENAEMKQRIAALELALRNHIAGK